MRLTLSIFSFPSCSSTGTGVSGGSWRGGSGAERAETSSSGFLDNAAATFSKASVRLT